MIILYSIALSAYNAVYNLILQFLMGTYLLEHVYKSSVEIVLCKLNQNKPQDSILQPRNHNYRKTVFYNP